MSSTDMTSSGEEDSAVEDEELLQDDFPDLANESEDEGGSQEEDEESSEEEALDGRNEGTKKKKRQSKTFYDNLGNPIYVDLKLEFGDGEIFLVDGDSLLFLILTTPDLVEWGPLGGSSLHVIYLVEKALTQFQERGGNPHLVFFRAMEGFWACRPTLTLLRRVVMLHFQGNTAVNVYTEFESVVDKKFQEFIIEESILMMFLTFPNYDLHPLWGCPAQQWESRKHLFYLLITLARTSGLNVSLLDEAVVSVASIHGFHMYNMGRMITSTSVQRQLKPTISQYRALLEIFEIVPERQLVSEDVETDPYGHVCSEVKRQWSKASNDAKNFVEYFLIAIAIKRTKVLANNFLPEIYVECKETCDLKALNDCMTLALITVAHCLPLQDIPVLLDPMMLMKVMYCHTACPERYAELTENTQILRQLKELKFKTSHGIKSSLHTALTIAEHVEKKRLCTVENQLFSAYLGNVEKNPDFPVVELNKAFEGKYHWHVLKPISDEHDRLSLSTMTSQTYANYMQKYGTSIEGGIVCESPIVVQSTTTKTDKKAEKKSKLSKKALDIIRTNMLKEVESSLRRLDSDERTKDNKILELKRLLSKLRVISAEDEKAKKLFEACNKKLLILYLEKAQETFARGKRLDFKDAANEAEFLVVVRKIMKFDLHKYSNDKEVNIKELQTALITLGYIKFVTETFPKNQHVVPPNYLERSLVHFQLQHMGPYLELDYPSEPDPRIVGFIPDDWQRKLFDAIDNKQSALIIAPTSSGKTYASYYCMEQVLRESDDGLVVYVAPTKPLVNQVAATIYARFSKRKNREHAIYGVFTRDYRYNTTKCQILVTVPACLEILLLSSPQADWCKRLKYVIFDEVHNIGAEGDASVWERAILAIRCPFLALSATVSNPKDLYSWMLNLEQMKEKQDKELRLDGRKHSSYDVQLVEYGDRHADLIKFVCHPGETDGPNTTMTKDDIVAVHPLTLVKVSDIVRTKQIPRHVTLSAKESLQLYTALTEVLGKEKFDGLEPSKYFTEKFISRNAVKTYYLLLLSEAEVLPAKELNLVISRLPGFTEFHKYKNKDKAAFVSMLQMLKNEQMLPAIVFVYDRKLCEQIPFTVIDVVQEVLDKKPEQNVKKAKKKNNDDEEEKFKKRKKPENDNFKVVDQKSEKCSSNAAMDFFTEFCHDSATFVRPNSLGPQDAEFHLNRLRSETNPTFLRGLQMGLSWHHAGNNNARKMATEMLFRCGFLNLVVSTTTLAQGIHMPCKSVIFFSDSLYLNTLSYHQCSGRAGRRGFDSEGNVIFFNVPRAKASRLVTSPLPVILGNEPVSLSLILRLLSYVSNIKMKGQDQNEAERYAVNKALCLLQGSLIMQVRPSMEPQLKNFFTFAIDYLARQGFINSFGEPIGLAGLASHLHYSEPYNFAFCYILREGSLHKLCKRDKHGNFTEKTMEQLLLVIATLFGRRKLNKSIYNFKKAKGLFRNSKVLLEEPPKAVKECLDRFNKELGDTFSNFLHHLVQTTDVETCLPLSKMDFTVRSDFKNVRSLFAPISNHHKLNVNERAINGLFNNVNRNLFTTFVPFVETNECLNRYILDFYNHGILQDLERDNGIQRGEIFQELQNFTLAIQAITTSLKEIGPNSEIEDDVISATKQLANKFSVKFNKAFPNKKQRLRKGCYKIHSDNCFVCDHLEEGKTVLTLGNKPFSIRGLELNCMTPSVIYALKCLTCKKIHVGDTIKPLSEKLKSFVEQKGLGDARVKKCFQANHRIVIQALETFSPNEAEMNRKKTFWSCRLNAESTRI